MYIKSFKFFFFLKKKRNLNVTLNEDNSYDLVLTYISKNNQNTNCGDPYINYIFILRKLDDYTVYKIKSI